MDSKKCRKRRAQADQCQCKKRKRQIDGGRTQKSITALFGRPCPWSDIFAPASSTTILDVNNDCLENVFSFLNMEDLLNVADSNTYLRSSVISTLCRKHKIRTNMVKIDAAYFKTKCGVSIQIVNDSIVIWKPLQAFKFLRLVGQQMTQLYMRSGKNGKKIFIERCAKIMDYICEYCSDTLTSLKLWCGTDFNAMKTFTNLEHLSVSWTELNTSNLNETFPRLRTLSLSLSFFIMPGQTWIATKFNQLEELRIVATSPDILSENLVKQLIELNPGLRCLSLPCDFVPDAELLLVISRHQKRLETLKISYESWSCVRYKGAPFKFESVQTLHLTIGRASMDRFHSEMIKVFSFDKLKECSLTGWINYGCIRFALEIPTIETLHIESTCTFDLDANQLIGMLSKSQSINKFQITDAHGLDQLNELKDGMTVTTDWHTTIVDDSIIIERKQTN